MKKIIFFLMVLFAVGVVSAANYPACNNPIDNAPCVIMGESNVVYTLEDQVVVDAGDYDGSKQDPDTVIFISGSNNIELDCKGYSISTTTDSFRIGVHVFDSHAINVTNCEIYDFLSAPPSAGLGLSVFNNQEHFITGNFIHDNRVGVGGLFSAGPFAKFEENIIENNEVGMGPAHPASDLYFDEMNTQNNCFANEINVDPSGCYPPSYQSNPSWDGNYWHDLFSPTYPVCGVDGFSRTDNTPSNYPCPLTFEGPVLQPEGEIPEINTSAVILIIAVVAIGAVFVKRK